MNTIKRFIDAVNKVMAMKVSEFIKNYKDLLPPFDFVAEDDSVEELLKFVEEGKHYIIVIDRRGRLRGIVTYIDLLLIFGKPKTAFLPFSSIATSFSKIKVPTESLLRMPVAKVMERLPQHVRLDEKVEDATIIMHVNNIHHVVIVDEEGMVWGLMTAHSIFRAILREAGIERKKIEVVDEHVLFKRFKERYKAEGKSSLSK